MIAKTRQKSGQNDKLSKGHLLHTNMEAEMCPLHGKLVLEDSDLGVSATSTLPQLNLLCRALVDKLYVNISL